MHCTTAINTSNTIRIQMVLPKRHSSGQDSNLCYYIFNYSVIMPNFMKIDQTVVEIWLFNGFSKWRPSAIFDLLDTYLDHQQRLLDGLYCRAEFGWNRSSGFDTMAV